MIPRNGWRCVYDADLEADDLIAEAVAQALENPDIRKIVVFSKDSDLNQILGWPSTSDQTLVLSRIESEVSVSDVESSTGVPVNRYAEWKALCGDTSDNIMGIPSVGPKSAAALINEWGNLASIPTDLLTRHRVLKPIELSALMKKFREDEDISMYRAKKDYGSVWESLEKTKREFVSVSEYNAIQQVIAPEYFEFVDFRPILESNLKLIRLPFRPDLDLIWNPKPLSESPTSETVLEASVSEPKLGQE